jgi:diguanylate cyclase (GGDEF)-like protein
MRYSSTRGDQPELHPSAEPGADDAIPGFVLAVSLFAAGVGLGGLAGCWTHPFAAIALVLPIVAFAGFLYRRQVAGVVALGAMASWALSRGFPSPEPAWSVLFTFGMSLFVLVGTGWLVESLQRARQQARHYAQTEPLTGLLNRNAFLSRLQTEIDRCRRREHPLAVAFLDCDQFKTWNDEQGHLAGDEVLRLIARTLQNATRAYDAVARMGGDEFAVLFPEVTDCDAEIAGRRVHSEVGAALRELQIPVTVSSGLVGYDRPPADAREVLATADALMYSAKELGKDRITTLFNHAVERGEATQFDSSGSDAIPAVAT